jgi:uncharacterized protein
MYYVGHGVPQDYNQASDWYHKAADQGDADAQFYLGCMFYYGRGVAQDYKQALDWYLKAADQGYAPAQNRIGGVGRACSELP